MPTIPRASATRIISLIGNHLASPARCNLIVPELVAYRAFLDDALGQKYNSIPCLHCIVADALILVFCS